jgi:hypothetical protein
MLALPAALQAQYNYTSDNGLISITGYTGSNALVTIPDVIDSQPVNSIGTWAFAYNTGVVSLTVPNTATSIEEWAFYGCSLTSVVIGNGVTNINGNAFNTCTQLFSVVIGNSVSNIGSYAFSGCTNLASITIPNSVSNIGSYAFAGCTSLTNIYFLGNTPTTDWSAIYGGTPAIDPSVFNGDTNATVYHIPGTMGWTLSFGGRPTALGNPVAPQTQFTYTTNKGAITITRYTGAGGAVAIPEEIYNLPVTSIGYAAFYNCPGVTSVTIPNSITNIVDWAFAACTHMTTATIGNGVTSIGYAAFNGCANLTGLFFHGNAPTLGSYAFYDVSGAIVNYLPGATGWGATCGGLPTLLWNPQLLTADNSFGVRENQFGFNIIGNSNLVIVVDACTNLANPSWSVAGTTTLTGSPFYFYDPLWTNHPTRFYRLRTP